MVKENQEDNIKIKLDEPIAIVGMNCQFPGIDGDVENVDAFYDLLMAGETPIREVPKERWDIDAYYDTDRKKADKIITRQGGFLNHPSLFDAIFFKISSTEAKQIDPQHRLFMEVAIRAILHANMPLASLKDSNTGVYCGISTHEYSQLNYKDKIQFNAYTPIGVANSAAAGRLCHFLKLKGPSMAVDTACSSSLSALYLAVTALRTQQCDMAIAGGVHLSLCPESCIGLTKANMLSATGQCRSFDSQANGFARSEGSAVVIVKRLSDAIKDKNTIHAVIKSIVMNQDGDGAGLAAPNVNAQIALHQAVLAEAKMNPSDIDYIETHGTGTPVGDAAEFGAIQAVHEGHHTTAKPLVLGALKSILGHTISSSGIASLIKVIGVLKNESIPPNLHYASPNSQIDPDRIPAVFPVQPMSFPQHPSKKRVAQVLNFSFSGTNVSAIIEEYSDSSPKSSFSDSARSYCFVLSANSETSLKQMLINHLQYLRQSSASLGDICYTLMNCRDHYKFRCAIIAEDKTTLIKKIESGDYEIKKVVATTCMSSSGDPSLAGDDLQYNKVDLPLYCFDRKPYWHMPRENPLPLNRNDEPIAIIGMSCRFPKANNLDAFLSLLQRGEDGMVDIPIDRWDNAKYYDEKMGSPGRLYIKQLGLIDNIKNFDAEFFDISPREAKLLSPNLRIFLETCYHALEHANLPLESIKGSNTGVFVGCERNDYAQLLKNEGMSQEDFDLYLATGNVMSAIPGRIAYVFNFHGPIQTIDTACSSSMTAIHNACLSLNAMDCDMAIAGGINLLLNPDSNITLSKAKMLSPDSRCKTFSEDADGYARSEGCGVVVLKRLRRAIDDNDTILALIKSSALNGDGKSDGFTVPNPKAQEAVIRQALARANLSPGEIDYVEAHGTGTPVADPIEANVLSKIFGESHSKEKPVYISSVKTNIGHCESASGVAGVIKTVLSLQHQILFKHLHFKQLNPEIHLKHVEIPLNHLRCKHPLKYAGINSFGFSGANAHLILQQVPQRLPKVHPQKEWLLMISAKKKTALKLLLSSYQNYLLTTKDDFADICYTAATCRHHFSYRVVIKASSAHEAASIIAQNQYAIHHVSKEKKSGELPHSLAQLQAAYQDGFVVHALSFYQSLGGVFEKVNLPLYAFERTVHWFNFGSHVLPSRRIGDEGVFVPQTALTPSPSPTSGRGEQLEEPGWLNDYHDKTKEQKFELCKNMVLESCRKVQEVSETDLFEEDDGFFDIGFDSLMLTELSYELKDKLEPWVSVTVNIGFDYPSINKLTNYIQEALDTYFISTPRQPKLPLYSDDDIAIIGMSCSFPNAPDITAFEALLEDGLSGIKDIPIERWDNSKYYSANREAAQKTYVNQMGLLDDIKAFDAQFFGISPREAKLMDPQQRLFLECCYHALENANYHPQSLKESLTGVFAGVSTNEYYARLEKLALSDEALSLHSITGNVLNLVSGRVAYAFDFKGPSISFDTACSSSLVAIHYACQSLKNREVDYALAGGVNLLLSPESNIKLCKARALSPDGQCKTFDETADGFVRSEGCGVIFLKRMSDAIDDKDNILAVIKASMVNNDGKSAGLTVPNGASQEEVMRRALKQTALSIHDIDYIEAHGTGTPLGDPIEVHAVNRVYGSQRPVDKPLYIGSVKTNIGHLESASGVASVIKTVISLQKQKIYKHLNFNQLNPTIKLGDTRIALQNTDWKKSENKPKSAGINAFGFSGTNAHVILQEYVSESNQKPARRMKKHLLVLSAKTKTALDRLVNRYQRYLESTQDDFADICFTAATCRAHYAYRLALTAESANQASHLLEIGQFSLSHEKKLTVAIAESVENDNLLDDYLNGAKVDWARDYQTRADEYKKVILPNYPFDRSEFWLDEAIRSPLPLVGEGLGVKAFCGTEASSSATVLQHLYYTEWEVLKDLPLIENQKILPEFWVISHNRTKAKQRLGHLRYQFIENQNDIEQIENKNILFFYEEGQLTALWSFCRQLFAKNPLRFILITENAYAINKTDAVNPDHTMASAFWKSFSNEIVLHKNYTVDLGTDSALLPVLAFILNESNTENQFALRDTIYVPRLKKKQFSEPSLQQEILLDSEASYLIVGGTGGLAQPLINYLIRRNAKHIVIISRSACSENQRRFIEQASDQQITIKHYRADATQYQPMAMIMKDIAENAPPLKGVFHLAGVIQDSMIINLTDEAMHRVVQTKKDSALVLHQLTMDTALDFFVLFSSSASVLGGRGQANYAASNGFLDGLGHQRHQQGKPAIVINWGPFHSVGMAASLIQGLQHQGFIPLDPSSIDILDVLLKSSLVQISPCPMDWDCYLKHSPKQRWLSDLIQQTSPVEPIFLRSLQQQSKDDCFKTLCQVLCEMTADILALESVEKITAHDRLYSLGMDSLLALELRHRIHDKLQCEGLSLSIEYFINDPTIEKIAGVILEELQTNLPASVLQKEESDSEVALCDFQYLFWVLNRLGYSSNVGMQLRLHGQLNKEFLSKAFDFVVQHNSAFWLNFYEDSPTQKIQRKGQFQLIEKERVSEDFTREFNQNMMRMMPLTEQPLIRVYLYKIQPSLHELHLVIPHIIIDDMSCSIVLNQFKACYQALCLGNTPKLLAERETYLRYVQQNNAHYEQDLTEKIAFWREYNQGFKKLYFGSQYHLPDAAIQQNNYLLHYTIPDDVMEAFVHWHQAKNRNISSGLIAICQMIFFKMSHQKKFPITILHSGREGSQYKPTVGLFAEYKRINICLNEEDNFFDCINAIETQLLKTAPYQKCALPIKEEGLKGTRKSVGDYLTFAFNKRLLANAFKRSKRHPLLLQYYLSLYSHIVTRRNHIRIKDKLNQLLDWKIPLQKPAKLDVLISITPSFFNKKQEEMRFANLDYTYGSHYGCLDRAVGNQTLWIYFTKNQHGAYQLSINGPLTKACKDQMAADFNHILSKLKQSDESQVIELI